MADFTIKYPTGSTLYITAERISDATLYTIILTDNGDNTYTGNMDSSAPLGEYICRTWKQIGVSPDTDVDTLLHPGETRTWSGSAFDFDKAVQIINSPYRNAMTWK
jgi:hypothetical protein